MAKVTVFCAHCGNPKEVPPCRVDGRKHFCNASCSGKYRTQNGSTVLTCATCGNPYRVPNFFASGKNNRHTTYCSKKCQGIAKSSNMMGDKNHNWKLPIKKTCVVCGKQFSINEHNNRVGYGKCCSIACKGKYQSITYRREKHWLWQGGRNIDYGPDWERIAQEVRKRDNYTCAVCGAFNKGGIFRRAHHVHHIKPLRSFNGNYELANRKSNLITICHSCHKKVEHGKVTL